MAKVKRIRAKLGLKRYNVPRTLVRAKEVYNGLYANPGLFPAPNPPLPVLLAQIEDLDRAEQAVRLRTIGAAAVRDGKRDELTSSLECERTYVQSCADADPAQSAILIAAAGMSVAKPPSHGKSLLTAKPVLPSGSVRLRANLRRLTAGLGSKKVFVNWQYSLDGYLTFVSAPSTPVATTVIPNLPPLTEVGFRVSITDPDGQGEWSQIVTTLVR